MGSRIVGRRYITMPRCQTQPQRSDSWVALASPLLVNAQRLTEAESIHTLLRAARGELDTHRGALECDRVAVGPWRHFGTSFKSLVSYRAVGARVAEFTFWLRCCQPFFVPYT